MWGICGLAEELLVSQEEICLMHLFSFLFICECRWVFMWGVAWSQELCKIQFIFWFTLCHWTNSSHVSKDHSAVETLWTVHSMMQHSIPEVVNLQMEGIFILVLQYCLVAVFHHVYVQRVTSRSISKGELIFMLRCQSLSSKRAEYRSLHWYICGWVRVHGVLWEGTERRAWSHRLLSSHVLQPSVLLAWHKW